MSDKAFLDTNILVYAIEQDGSEKSAFALRSYEEVVQS